MTYRVTKEFYDRCRVYSVGEVIEVDSYMLNKFRSNLERSEEKQLPPAENKMQKRGKTK